MIERLIVLFAAALCVPFAASAQAQKFQVASTYICPNTPGTGLDCYLDAVVHLYTMCRHVKSIEIIEFGHAKAQEGVNGAKSEYCVDKQKINIARPYEAALREATGWREAVDDLRALQEFWLESMANLKWRRVSGRRLRGRVNHIYDELSYKIDAVRVASTPPDGAGQGCRAQGQAQTKAATPRKPLIHGHGRGPGHESGRSQRPTIPRSTLFFTGNTSGALPFRFWPQQLAMAQAIHGDRSATARCGSGDRYRQTFAYLVPALLYGGR
jgi:hypothetical protein